MDIDPASHRSPLNNRRSRWRRIGKRNNNNNNGASTPPTRNGPRGTIVDNDDDDVDSLYLEKMATPPKNSGSKLRWRGRILASSFRSRHGSAASSRRQQRGGDASSISSTSRNPAPSVGNHRAPSEAPEEAVRDEDEEYTDNDDVVVEEAAGAGTGTLSSDVRAMGPELDAVGDRMATAAAVIPPGRLSPAPAPALAPSGHLHPPPAPLSYAPSSSSGGAPSSTRSSLLNNHRRSLSSGEEDQDAAVPPAYIARTRARARRRVVPARSQTPSPPPPPPPPSRPPHHHHEGSSESEQSEAESDVNDNHASDRRARRATTSRTRRPRHRPSATAHVENGDEESEEYVEDEGAEEEDIEGHVATDDKAALARLAELRSEPIPDSLPPHPPTEATGSTAESAAGAVVVVVPDEETLVLHEHESALERSENARAPLHAPSSSSSGLSPPASSSALEASNSSGSGSTSGTSKSARDTLPSHLLRTNRPNSRSAASSYGGPLPHRTTNQEEDGEDDVPAYDESYNPRSTSSSRVQLQLPEPVVHEATAREYARLAASTSTSAAVSIPALPPSGSALASVSSPPDLYDEDEDEIVEPSAPPLDDSDVHGESDGNGVRGPVREEVDAVLVPSAPPLSLSDDEEDVARVGSSGSIPPSIP